MTSFNLRTVAFRGIFNFRLFRKNGEDPKLDVRKMDKSPTDESLVRCCGGGDGGNGGGGFADADVVVMVSPPLTRLIVENTFDFGGEKGQRAMCGTMCASRSKKDPQVGRLLAKARRLVEGTVHALNTPSLCEEVGNVWQSNKTQNANNAAEGSTMPRRVPMSQWTGQAQRAEGTDHEEVLLHFTLKKLITVTDSFTIKHIRKKLQNKIG